MKVMLSTFTNVCETIRNGLLIGEILWHDKIYNNSRKHSQYCNLNMLF